MILNSVYSKNISGRDFFLGDLHGNFINLKKLLRKIKFVECRDRLFAVGDLIDRGDFSYECLNLLREPWFFSVLGNHEHFLLDVESDSSFKAALWLNNGGHWWQYLSKEKKLEARELVASKVSLTLSVETSAGLVGVVHAQYPFEVWPPTYVNEEDIRKMLWGRSEHERGGSINILNVDYIVSGHTPLIAPKIIGKRIFIDTGEGYQPSEKIPNPTLTVCEFIKKTAVFHGVTKNSYTSICKKLIL
jgi:serine/threonine protein phosphatase 1